LILSNVVLFLTIAYLADGINVVVSA
jgi:hypothetical protein